MLFRSAVCVKEKLKVSPFLSEVIMDLSEVALVALSLLERVDT